MSLKDSMMKHYKKSQSIKSAKNSKAKNKPKEFDYSILAKGGESSLMFMDSKGKKREVCISVHTPLITYPPQYRYHYRNAFGNYIFIKCQKRELAQEVCNYLEGVSESGKVKYHVSGSSV